MTEQQLYEGMQQLARFQKEFADAVLLLVRTIESHETYIEAASKAFEAHSNAMDLGRETMDAHLAALKVLITSMESIIKGCAENNLAIKENTEHVKELVAKVESYFGSGTGLEYDN